MIKFLVFADFHYKKGMYASRVAHLEQIMQKAKDEKVDFVIHVGDLCNDYKQSPEIVSAYLSNKFGLSVFGVMGNHELEAESNSLQFVSPLLSNENIVFFSEQDGYWYFDIKEYRLIGLDTNYSYNPNAKIWEHNKTRSHGAPKGNENENSLSPKQLEWFEKTLADAEKKNMKSIVFSHVGFCPWWEMTPDASEVREIIEKHKDSVLLAVSGHVHSDDFKMWKDIPYFNVNAAINGCWLEQNDYHYSDEQKYFYDHFDESGKYIRSEEKPLNSLIQAKNTWFFDEPLYAVVAVDDRHNVKVKGSKTTWMHGLVPSRPYTNCRPEITGFEVIKNI